jgi:prophage DNA circulation protein
MSVLSGFYRASYNIGGKTATFYARRAEMPELGRKVAIHEYPNSDARYVEDFGKISGKYVLEIEIQETTASAYKRSRDALIRALNEEGIGTLTHPTLGKKKVVPVPSSMSEDFINELGIVNFSITFLESSLNKFPESTTGNKGYFGRLYDSIFSNNEGFFGEAISAYNGGLEVFNDVRDNIQEVTTTINDVVSTINGVADEAAAITADIIDFQASLISLLQTPTTLAQRFNQIFGTLGTITDNFESMVDICLNIFGSGNRTQQIGSSARVEALNQNREAVGNFTDTACLTTAYLASTNIDYTSQEQIDAMLTRLNDAFETLDPNSFDEEIYYELQDLRTQTRLFLQNLRTTLPYYVNIKTNLIPTAVLAYNFYANSSRSSEIDSLNGIEDPAFAFGNLTILSE